MASGTGSVTKIDTKNFKEAISRFGNAVTTYRSARERVFDSTEKLLFDWKGEGKDSFETQYTELKTKLKDEEDNLYTIKNELEDCLQGYLDWDAQLTAQFKASAGAPKKPYTPPILGGNNNHFNGSSTNPFMESGKDRKSVV